MTQTATVWLIYHITHSTIWLGIIAFIGQAPAIFLAPIAGVWVDRLDRKRLLLFIQVLFLFQSATLAFLTLSGRIGILSLSLLAMTQGLLTAFDMPTRQSLSILLAEKREDLPSVIAMNASMFHLARLAGPSIAGFIIAFYGVGICYLLDASSYIAVITAMVAMRLKQVIGPSVRKSVWKELKQGFCYVLGVFPIWFHILLTFLMGVFALSFATLLPAYAKNVFNGDARVLGILMSSSAVGSVAAAVYLAGRKQLRGIGQAILLGGIIAANALYGFAFSNNLPIAVVYLGFVGLGTILVLASNNTLVQSFVEEDKRGRVMSFYVTAFIAGAPVGALLSGTLAHFIGLRETTLLNALACLLLTLLYQYLRPRLSVASRILLFRREALAGNS